MGHKEKNIQVLFHERRMFILVSTSYIDKKYIKMHLYVDKVCKENDF